MVEEYELKNSERAKKIDELLADLQARDITISLISQNKKMREAALNKQINDLSLGISSVCLN